MQDEIISEIKLTPLFRTKQCRLLAYGMSYLLKFGALIVTVIVWLKTDYFFALATLLLSYVVMGIIRSKILHISIPPAQQEHSYSDLQIAHWFLDRRHCFESKKTDKIEVF